jgi:hypothetical protein
VSWADHQREQIWAASPGGKLARALEAFCGTYSRLDDTLRTISGQDERQARGIARQVVNHGGAVLSAVAPLLIELHKRHREQLN